MPKPRRQMSKYGVPASAATAASSRLGKRKLKVRIVESSEDSDVEDIIEQTGSVSLDASAATAASAPVDVSVSEEDEQTYHELARTAQQPQQRKKREIVITDELREHMDDAGMRCQKCGVKTKHVNIINEQIRGKSEGKSRSALRADCSKCGGRKFAFGKLAE